MVCVFIATTVLPGVIPRQLVADLVEEPCQLVAREMGYFHHLSAHVNSIHERCGLEVFLADYWSGWESMYPVSAPQHLFWLISVHIYKFCNLVISSRS